MLQAESLLWDPPVDRFDQMHWLPSPGKPKHISKTVLSIVKFGGAWISLTPGLTRGPAVASSFTLDLGSIPGCVASSDAASGGQFLGSNVSDVPLNPFELSILDGLRKRGIPVTPQYGVSGYRIDFACAHPEEPGRMVLAIEADGASYHSDPTARDRDRLRQQVLEANDWRFHRIWSTEWFRNRELELDRAEQAWKQAVETSEKGEVINVNLS